jgi:hypothetical protein
LDRSDPIHSCMRAAESTTKWREAADFDTPLPAGPHVGRAQITACGTQSRDKRKAHVAPFGLLNHGLPDCPGPNDRPGPRRGCFAGAFSAIIQNGIALWPPQTGLWVTNINA